MRRRAGLPLVAFAVLLEAALSASLPARALEQSSLFAVSLASDNAVLVWDEAILHGIRATKPGPRSRRGRSPSPTPRCSTHGPPTTPLRSRPFPGRGGAGRRRERTRLEQVRGRRATPVIARSSTSFRRRADYYDASARFSRDTRRATRRWTSPRQEASATSPPPASSSCATTTARTSWAISRPERTPTTRAIAPVNTPTAVNDPNRWQPLAIVVRQRRRDAVLHDAAVGPRHAVRARERIGASACVRTAPVPGPAIQDPGGRDSRATT